MNSPYSMDYKAVPESTPRTNAAMFEHGKGCLPVVDVAFARKLEELNNTLMESLSHLLQDAVDYGMDDSPYSGSLIEARKAIAKWAVQS